MMNKGVTVLFYMVSEVCGCVSNPVQLVSFVAHNSQAVLVDLR